MENRYRTSALLFSAMFGLLAVPSAAQPPEKPPVVRMIELNWSSGQAAQQILARILQTHLGFEVEWIAPKDVSLPGMAKGEADLIAEVWLPDQEQTWHRHIGPESDQTLHTNRVPYLASEGIYVPQRVAERHGIGKIEDLTRPEIARLFDSDGDGRGELWVGLERWVSSRTQEVKARSYGYAALFELQKDPEEQFRARLKQAYEADRPIVFYGWEPSETVNDLNLVRLVEPPFTGFRGDAWKSDPQYRADGCFHFVPREDPDWLLKSDIRCATPDSEVWVIHWAGFDEEHPQAGRFLHQVEFTLDMVQSWLRLMGDYGLAPEELAQLWVEENFEIVGDWLSADPETSD